MKVVIAIGFVIILGSLASAFFFLMKDRSKSPKTVVRSLTVRIGVSIALFLMILIAYSQGWIEPTGIR